MTSVIDTLTGASAADAATAAAGQSVAAQREALDYLKQQEALPTQFREGALTQLGGLYGLEGGDPRALLNLQATPMYEAVMSGLPAAEEAILRQQAATGGLRSGNVQTALAENTQQLQNQALQQSMQGLQGFTQLPSYAPQIAQQMAGIGQTQAAGTTAAAQAEQAGMGNLMNLGLGIGTMGAGAGWWSDIRLKENIKPAGEINGHNWYTWDWNEEARQFGLEGSAEGVMAHEVAEKMPDAISTDSGYILVNYEMLGVQ